MKTIGRWWVVAIGTALGSALAAQEILDLLGYRLAFHWNRFPHKDWYYNDIWGWTAPDGREYAILGTLDSTYFFDVTNPDSVVLVDVEAGRARGCVHRDYKTYRHYCYAVADEGKSSLQIFDLSYLPDSVHKVYDDDTFCQRSHNIFIDTLNAVLYLADNTYRTPSFQLPESVSLLSLADPENPTLIGHYPRQMFHNEWAHDVFVHDDTAFLALTSGLGIYDFSNPQSPQEIAYINQYPSQGYNHSSWASPRRRLLVFADETVGKLLKLYDYSTPSAPVLKAVFGLTTSNSPSPPIPHNPFIVGDSLVWISYYFEGVVAYDISDPNFPRKVFHYDTYPDSTDVTGSIFYYGCWGVYPFFPSGTVVASDITHGLFVFAKDPDTTSTSSRGGRLLRRFNVKVYPQPASDRVRVEVPARMPEVEWAEIRTVSGRLLRRHWWGGARTQTLPVNDLPSGAYIVQVGPYVGRFYVHR